jgi:hypothetical protein
MLLIPTVVLPLLLRAGGDPLPVGARFAGMGGSGLTLVDLWSLRLNPAGIAALEDPWAGLSYQRHFLSEALAHQALAAAVPLGKGAIGLAADRFGYELYNETRATLGYAMRFGDGLRAAVQLGYLGTRIGENYGRTGTVVAEAGMQAKVTDALWIGTHVYNPTRSALLVREEGAVPIDERIPTVMRAGLTYTFSDKLLMTAEVEKDIDRPERFRTGIEYAPNKMLYLRTGLSTRPVQAHFGAGVRTGRLAVDLAVVARSMLGPTPLLNLNYRFR